VTETSSPVAEQRAHAPNTTKARRTVRQSFEFTEQTETPYVCPSGMVRVSAPERVQATANQDTGTARREGRVLQRVGGEQAGESGAPECLGRSARCRRFCRAFRQAPAMLFVYMSPRLPQEEDPQDEARWCGAGVVAR